MVKRPRKKFLSRSLDAQIICAFQEWTAIGAEAEVAEREEEKRFQEDVNNDILSHHHRSVANQSSSSYKTVPQIMVGGRNSAKSRNLDSI